MRSMSPDHLHLTQYIVADVSHNSVADSVQGVEKPLSNCVVSFRRQWGTALSTKHKGESSIRASMRLMMHDLREWSLGR